jgi:hypothetical protein
LVFCKLRFPFVEGPVSPFGGLALVYMPPPPEAIPRDRDLLPSLPRPSWKAVVEATPKLLTRERALVKELASDSTLVLRSLSKGSLSFMNFEAETHWEASTPFMKEIGNGILRK